jgi:hypothetical protein
MMADSFKEYAVLVGRQLAQRICFGLIIGVAEGAIIQSRTLNAPRPFCPPAGVQENQMVHVVAKYIDQHPEVTHMRLAELAYLALKEAWPCKP